MHTDPIEIVPLRRFHIATAAPALALAFGEPHYFVDALGIVPGSQGRGIGSGLMSYLINLADRGGSLIYLSASTPENIPFYERFGFQVRDRSILCGVPVRHMEQKPTA